MLEVSECWLVDGGQVAGSWLVDNVNVLEVSVFWLVEYNHMLEASLCWLVDSCHVLKSLFQHNNNKKARFVFHIMHQCQEFSQSSYLIYTRKELTIEKIMKPAEMSACNIT